MIAKAKEAVLNLESSREGLTTLKDKSRELQRGLYLAAKRSRNRRFHALYDRIFRPDIGRREEVFLHRL